MGVDGLLEGRKGFNSFKQYIINLKKFKGNAL